ncbi:MAG: hypothetical protein KDC38_03670 [Planctomycetes bacterium]|nr:hypothetical protein [Planctomycetota bacterium]
MSDDLSLRSDEEYSECVDAADLREFIGQLRDVHSNGTWSFAFGDSVSTWMEIDLEVVSEQGDRLEGSCPHEEGINRVRLHIAGTDDDGPDAAPRAPYARTMLEIAEYLEWPLVDEQSGLELDTSSLAVLAAEHERGATAGHEHREVSTTSTSELESSSRRDAHTVSTVRFEEGERPAREEPMIHREPVTASVVARTERVESASAPARKKPWWKFW